MNARFDAPTHLSERSKAIWAKLVPARCRSIGRTTLLQTALEALDLADRATAELAATDSLLSKGEGKIPHLSPLLRVVKESKSQFAKIWADLGLQFSGSEDGCDLSVWLRRNQAEVES